MASRTPTRAQAVELVRLTPEESETRLFSALRESYWPALATDLHLTADDAPRGEPAASAAACDGDRGAPTIDLAAASAHFQRHGYFHARGALDGDLVASLARGVRQLKQAGWPPVFAFVFDEPWSLLHGPRVRALLAALLDTGDVRRIDRVWVHHVAPNGSGWQPHVDGWAAAHRVTLWIPLTEATPENGCIHVLPRSRVPDATVARFLDRSTAVPRLDHDEIGSLLQAVRALPASPGDLLGWDFGLLHWGSASSAGAPPRISMAAEFVRGDEPHGDEEPPRRAMDALPTFRERLTTIANAILLYDRFELIAVRYGDFARRLLAALAEPAAHR